MNRKTEIRRQVERRIVAVGLATMFSGALSRGRVMAALLQAGYTPGPGESDDALFRRFLSGTERHRATPRQMTKSSQLVVRPHPRQAEIDALPTQVSMPCDGRGVFWRQGNADYIGKEG
ncbi:MAG: hypothetical protein KUL86_06680 [Castellaniella sp.]|nr:hypothetical protein [Castellaniella sp.]